MSDTNGGKTRIRVETVGTGGFWFAGWLFTIGFARRFATYKRLDLLLHDPARLERILG